MGIHHEGVLVMKLIQYDSCLILQSFHNDFFRILYCISSDFSDLPAMTDEYIELSVTRYSTIYI